MKKLLGIVVLGLLWCNVSFAETIESIEKKYESSLPECEGGEAYIPEDLMRVIKWNNCFGTQILIEGDQKTIFNMEFKDGDMKGKGTIMGLGGVKFFVEFKGGGFCKRNGYALLDDGRIFKAKYSKTCDPKIVKDIK